MALSLMRPARLQWASATLRLARRPALTMALAGHMEPDNPGMHTTASIDFDYVVSVTTLHNLYVYELEQAVKEIQRVGKGSNKHIAIESYRNEREKANLLYWQLTCRSFYTPEEWEWVFEQCGYTGDYSYIVFE